jgi:type IV secretion system protein VirB6
MSSCQPFAAGGPQGIADALSKTDCLAAEATSLSFARLFGESGAFRVALTIMLTLYVALMAINLLTGRSTLRLSTLTPRMMTMGLVLTFVTSWIAYQTFIWNLAVGAPDEIASVLVGTKGSATTMFAERLDVFFNAITEAASSVHSPTAATAATLPTSTLTSPSSVLSIASIILLVGTVGMLVACRLALAALLILGPVFIVMALFPGTRGLFEGWLKSVAMFALVPLLTVLLGSGALLALEPMIADLAGATQLSMRTAVSILLVSIIYLALMFLTFRVAGTLTSSWRMSKEQSVPAGHAGASMGAHGVVPALNAIQPATPALMMASERVRSSVIALSAGDTSERSSVTRLTTSSITTTSGAQIVGPAHVAATGFRHSSYISHRLQKAPSKSQQGLSQ